ncbi:addiction module protein [Enhygromyxa salina]|uniref:Putative addiction module component n=1 Tax=Enhygromyxa salina TaxID=215803 RepID=A0A2S9YQK8_9BACT|nr:addiction module protein [Enhygromyxa salina]PRQ07377.1 putative addiction module component [Enhygromyxa salina]
MGVTANGSKILVDSIGDGSSSKEIEAAWVAEAKRRAEAIDQGELGLVDSEEMMARLRPLSPRTHRSVEHGSVMATLRSHRISEARPTSDDAERDRVIAKIERGLADVEAGRVVPHAEVMARLEARYGSKK